jgi:hypothetical protein
MGITSPLDRVEPTSNGQAIDEYDSVPHPRDDGERRRLQGVNRAGQQDHARRMSFDLASAIARHQNQARVSRDHFRALPARAREKLLTFLTSL